MKSIRMLLVLPYLLTGICHAATTSDSTTAAQRWVAARFLGVNEPTPSAKSFLEARLKPNALVRDRIEGHPLLIVDQKFDNGIAMRSPGEIIVRLSASASSFQGTVGVDSNDLGYYANTGRGNVVASVEAGGRQLFESPVLHEGIKGIPFRVELGGAREITLRLKAVGERPSTYQAEWDQADWGDATITLADGSKLLLSSLPTSSLAQEYSLNPPFSFQFGDQLSADLLKKWPVDRKTRQMDDQRTEYTSVYQDPATHLVVRCVAVAYHDFPIVEWTVYFKNEGSKQTPILQDIKALDADFEGDAQGTMVLHHPRGSSDSANDYEPLEIALPAGAQEHFASVGGRGTDGEMPYFNLAAPGRGVIFALGWPGQWSLDLSRDQSAQVHVRGGQELTHFWLAPGEEVRTPLAVVQFWDGDWICGQNVWRQWMLAHNLPRSRGKLPAPFVSGGSSRYTIEMQFATEENQKKYIDQTLQDGIPINYWWMDAGWYPFTAGWWKTGTWDPDLKRFPNGLKAVADYAHAKNLKVILWFEPERVTQGSWLDQHHPEWLLGPDGKDKLLDLGNPEAWHWLADHVSSMIADTGIDVYRQDFNFPPLQIWRAHDAPDRQGITEIKHVEGYLAYFDELRRRFPNLLIDTCASGGRRNDLETLRRAVPLWRSDYPYKPISQQAETYGLSLWIPFYGTAINSLDPYIFRSQMTPALGFGLDHQQIEGQHPIAVHLLKQWRDIVDYFYANFIPLTPYSLESSTWMAWQWNRPEDGSGVIEVFRRENSPFTTAQFKLQGLDPAAHYSVKNLDSPASTEFTGKVLMQEGLAVTLQDQPASALLMYRKSAKK
ncbi:alpha-galactosidase [Acidobacterium sp. S8]|uniref:alpha-galactosidase n=1 Tax=Acidobacterium sp. S8 TaxID=1641854 RepID=UPI00131E98ED|nr:alpha-galactosidase [Acidobacterium sp. S8]